MSQSCLFCNAMLQYLTATTLSSCVFFLFFLFFHSIKLTALSRFCCQLLAYIVFLTGGCVMSSMATRNSTLQVNHIPVGELFIFLSIIKDEKLFVF